MRITIAAVGKMKASPEREIMQRYVKQTPWRITIKEVDVKKTLESAARKKAESALLLDACEGCHALIALDERGKPLGSEPLAAVFSGFQNNGQSHIGIVIGGQDGLDESVRDKALLVLSFGALTWPHMLVRSMLAEQLYRVHTLLTGHPYHRV